ncbi:50S ribosomal protein L24 [Spiroplasma culicicola]|uniref:Large ribosomal subunit protein uL24 n=1 Tax=Spiroplasma culicicola AES-1 TaxID=1276246 RepID=W6A8G5_9MOLU|nr:50S ribosomal protein L24 [Spiroplasma culicicola]AHI53297.1 50S ribosomal protein L24 [Spiroplasma culicicola AES-1]
MNKSKILKGDVVKVISGNHKGTVGPVTKLSKDKKRVWVEGITGTKHFKPSQTDQEGGIRMIPVSVDISNVAIQDPKNKENGSRIGYKITDGNKVRIAKKSKAELK